MPLCWGLRLAVGARVLVKAYGAVGLSERFMYDDKLVCASEPVSAAERSALLVFPCLRILQRDLERASRSARALALRRLG